METVHKLEQTVASWYKGLPHLPENGRKWLATNVWWLVLIGVILSALSVITLLFGTLLAGALFAGVAGAAGAAVGGLLILGVLVTLAMSVVMVVLGGMAISPLKAMQKKGWTLLFVLFLLEVAATVASGLLSYNFLGLIWGLLWVAVGGYFLFEIHDYYKEAKK